MNDHHHKTDFWMKLWLARILKVTKPVVFTWLIVVIGFVVLMNWVEPLFPAATRSAMLFFSTAIAVIVLLKFPFFTGTLSGRLVLGFLLFFELTFYRPFIFSHIELFPLLVIILSAIIFVWGCLTRGAWIEKAIRTLVIFFGVVPFLILLSIAITYRGQDRCSTVEQNARITFVLDFCADRWKKDVAKLTGLSSDILEENEQARSLFISSNKEFFLAGTGLQDDAHNRLLMVVSRKDHKVVKAFVMGTPWRGICRNGLCAVSVSMGRAIYLIDERTLKIAQTVKMPFRPLFFAEDPNTSTLFLPLMVGDHLATFDLKRKKLYSYDFRKTIQYVFPYGIAMGAVYNAKNRNLYVVSERYLARPCLFVYTFSKNFAQNPLFTISCFSYWEAWLSLGNATGIAFHPQRQEIYMALPLEGNVYVIDERTRQLKKKMGVGVGIREVTVDPKKDLLYVSNYINGKITALSLNTGRKVDEFFVGKRIRQLIYEPRLDRLLVASANGFMEVKPHR